LVVERGVVELGARGQRGGHCAQETELPGARAAGAAARSARYRALAAAARRQRTHFYTNLHKLEAFIDGRLV
jgi:hypothetical protein